MVIGDDNDPLSRRIELVLEVGLEPLDVGAQAIEGGATRTILFDDLVELALDLQPGRAARGTWLVALGAAL